MTRAARAMPPDAARTFLLRVALFVLLAALPGRAAAQAIVPGPPGPYVIDVRGAMAGVPQSASFYPAVPVGTSVPARGFGLELGAHIYPVRLGPGRLGIGVSVEEVRASTTTTAPVAGTTGTQSSSSQSSSSSSTASSAVVYPDIAARERLVAPQLSLNFGTHDGWSYLSVGYGTVHVKTDATASGTPTLSSSHTGNGVNVGGGARWFLDEHVAVGFDFRVYRIPATTIVGVSAGFSVR